MINLTCFREVMSIMRSFLDLTTGKLYCYFLQPICYLGYLIGLFIPVVAL